VASKFKERDRVVVRGSIPQYFGPVARLHRVRTITTVYYNKSQQHNLYYLGTNKRGTEFPDYSFRASELELAPGRSIGRPKIRRAYKRTSPDILETLSKPLEINPVESQGFTSLIGVHSSPTG